MSKTMLNWFKTKGKDEIFTVFNYSDSVIRFLFIPEDGTYKLYSSNTVKNANGETVKYKAKNDDWTAEDINDLYSSGLNFAELKYLASYSDPNIIKKLIQESHDQKRAQERSVNELKDATTNAKKEAAPVQHTDGTEGIRVLLEPTKSDGNEYGPLPVEEKYLNKGGVSTNISLKENKEAKIITDNVEKENLYEKAQKVVKEAKEELHYVPRVEPKEDDANEVKGQYVVNIKECFEIKDSNQNIEKDYKNIENRLQENEKLFEQFL